MQAKLVLLHTLSPLHAGTGQGIGVIDLPIAREKVTGIPYLPGSSCKGVLRTACVDKAMRKKLFGPETDNAADHAGSLQFSDLSLLCLPLRSFVGTFAWVTSPFVLKRFARDLRDIGLKGLPEKIPAPKEEQAFVTSKTKICTNNNKVIFEDLDLDAVASNELQSWAVWLSQQLFADPTWQELFVERLCLISDDMLSYFLETGTEINARIKIKEETKSVEKGGLWYEENLPAESILYGLALFQSIKVGSEWVEAKEAFGELQKLSSSTLQFGGKATVGRGLCSMRLVGGAS